MRLRLPLPILSALALNGCGNPGADVSNTADLRNEGPAARAAEAHDRASALEARAARLEAEVTQLAAQSGAAADFGNVAASGGVARAAPLARAAPPPRAVIASRAAAPGARRVTVGTVTAKKSNPVQPAKPAPGTSISAGELQRRLAPSGILQPAREQPKLDYDTDP